MNFRAFTLIVLGIVVIVAVVGMPLMLASPTHHEMGCPFVGEAALCATSVLEHVEHWHIAFASILAELLLGAALALVALRKWDALIVLEPSFARIRKRSGAPERPTLLQELFSHGILNRKEPYLF